MKIREGFVSNSSSSSFVLFGFEISKDDFNLIFGEKSKESDFDPYDEAYDSNLDLISEDDNQYYIGKQLRFDEDDSVSSTDFDELYTSDVKELEEKINKKPKIIYGTIYN